MHVIPNSLQILFFGVDLGFLIEFQKKIFQYYLKNINYKNDKSNSMDVNYTALRFTTFLYINYILVIHQTFYNTPLKSMMDWEIKGLIY